nr:uncharacterized protein LOC109351185 [Ipomoea batatas]
MLDPAKANKTQLLNPDFAEQLICQNLNQIYSGRRIAVSVMMIVLMVTMTVGWSSRANHIQLKVLCAHRAFMWLAFLQPEPNDIMLILSFPARAPDNSFVIVGFDNSRCFLQTSVETYNP